MEKLQNEMTLFGGLSKWKFSTGKKHFTPGKTSEKMTLLPQKNFPVMPLALSYTYKMATLNIPTQISADLVGKKEAWKKGKWVKIEKKRRKIVNGR